MNRQRLLDEYVLPRLKGGRRERGMRVVPGGNEHRVHLRVPDDVPRVGRVRTEAELLAHALRGDPTRRRHRNQPAALPCGPDQELLRKTACPDEADADTSGRAGRRVRRLFDCTGRRCLGILEKDAQVSFVDLAGHDVVCLPGFLDVKHVRNQRLHIQAPVLEQPHERSHVTVLGPPDIAVRVILPSLLVRRVVAPGPVRQDIFTSSSFL